MDPMAFDAEYVDRMVGKVLVKACAAVTLAKPYDPIEFLSLWLHKYCDNVTTMQNLEREKAAKIYKEAKKQAEVNRKIEKEVEFRGIQQSVVSHLRTINDDPYLLWETCLKAITSFTGCSGVYVAVVVNKVWEPKPEKKKPTEGEEGEDGEEEGDEPVEEEEGEEGEGRALTSDDSSIEDEDEPKEKEEGEEGENEEGEGEAETEAELEDEVEADDQEGGEGEEDAMGGEGEGGKKLNKGAEGAEAKEKPPKPPKPLNYKRKKLLYVAAIRPSNIHMLNRQLDLKSGPVTYSLLIEGLPELHIPNVLYKEGVHFFGGVPRIGAYFVVPITIEFIAKKYLKEENKVKPKEWWTQVRQKQVIALLCCDTLKLERIGTGKTFLPADREFISTLANTMSVVLDQNDKEIKKDQNTLATVEKFQGQLKEIKLARKAQLDKQRDDAIKAQKAKEKEKRRKEFEEMHKAWEDRQVAKAEAKTKKETDKTAKKAAGEEGEEEEETVAEEGEEEDPEPIEEPKPDDELEKLEGEEGDAEKGGEGEEEEEEVAEEGEEGDVEGKDGEEGADQKPKDGLDDAELEPDPMAGLEEAKIEGEEGETAEGDEGEDDELDKEKDEDEEEEEEATVEGEEVEVGEGGEEVEGGEGDEGETKEKKEESENDKMTKKLKKEIKDLKKEIIIFEKARKKAIQDLQNIRKDAVKYESALHIADGVVKYLKIVLDNVYALIVEVKDSELLRMKRWPYPNRHVQRVLKAVLYLLGHKKIVIDDWISARKLFTSDFVDKVLKDYNPMADPDPIMWKAVDTYLAGLKDVKLLEQAPFGFLLHQWILACKKLTNAGVKYHIIKKKFEELSKGLAEKELTKIMCEVETQLASENLTKIAAAEEARLAIVKAHEEAEKKRLVDIAIDEEAAKAAAEAAAGVEGVEGEEKLEEEEEE